MVSGGSAPPWWHNELRAFHQWRKPGPCYRAILAAEQAAADEVRYRRQIQQLTTSLLPSPDAASLPGLQAFAHRTRTPAFR